MIRAVTAWASGVASRLAASLGIIGVLAVLLASRLMTAVEPLSDAPGSDLEMFEADRRRLNALWRDCQKLSHSKLVPDAYKGDTETIYALARYGEPYGLAPIHAVQRLYVINGRIEPSAQVLAGVVMSAGHEVRFEETSSSICTVAIRRDGTDYWQKVTWTIEDARRAGLLDMWVEVWKSTQSGKKYPETFVVGDDRGVDQEKVANAPDWVKKELAAGKVKVKENWAKYPDDMLAAAAMRRAAKRVCPDALLNLPDPAGMPVEELASPDRVAATHEPERTPDDEVVDGEEVDGTDPVVEQPTDDDEVIEDAEEVTESGDDDAAEDVGGGDDVESETHLAAPAGEGDDSAADETAAVDDRPAGQGFTRSFAMQCRDTQTPDGRTLDDEDRHAIVAHASGGRTRSAKDVWASEVSGCYSTLRAIERGQLELDDVDGVRTVKAAG